METNFLFSGVAVTDFAAADDWYRRLFGRPADVLVAPGVEAMWRLSDTASRPRGYTGEGEPWGWV